MATERRNRSGAARALGVLASVLDPRLWIHPFRLLHYYNYSHVAQRRRLTCGAKVWIAPNVSFRNGERITLGDRVQIGERCGLWAGDISGRIIVGAHSTFGPDCYLTASDYGTAAEARVVDQPKRERDVVIGEEVWLGTRVIVTAGVTIGRGCIVGAGSVVTRDLPEMAIAVGVPARVVGMRGEASAP